MAGRRGALNFLLVEVGIEADDVEQNLGGLVHPLGGGALEDPVEIEAAGAQVGAGQALPAQDSAVGAAADRDFLGVQTGHPNGGAGGLHQMEMGLDLLDHIAVAVLDLDGDGARAVTAVEPCGNLEQLALFVLQTGGVVVPQDIAQLGLVDIAVHLAQVIEALAALGGLGTGHQGESHMELHGHVGGVNHGILGAAGVNRQAPDGDGGRSGVEVLVLDAAHVAAVHRVGEVSAEPGNVEQVGSLADLLVGGEGNAELAMGGALPQDRFRGGEDFGHARLVVGAQQGGAVRGDEGFALHGGQEGEGGDFQHRTGAGQDHILAVVVLMDHRLDVFARGIGGRCPCGRSGPGPAGPRSRGWREMVPYT